MEISRELTFEILEYIERTEALIESEFSTLSNETDMPDVYYKLKNLYQK